MTEPLKIRMGRLRHLRNKLPFCPLCFRYLTPEQAKKHKKHSGVIRWPK